MEASSWSSVYRYGSFFGGEGSKVRERAAVVVRRTSYSSGEA
jgi:hypothetical protein